jgi:hypothetical protein
MEKINAKPVEKGLVSALMVTKKDRQKLAYVAAGDFHQQIYYPKELVVVIDPPGYFPPFAYSLALCYEKFAFTLGELRTISINAARGEYVAQWDDDDRSRPDRISVQVAALKREGAEICFLRRVQLKCLCGHTAISNPRLGEAHGYWECTMMARRSALEGFAYPSLAAGEDSAFVLELESEGRRIITIDDPEIYTYRFHGANTWSAKHFDRLFSMSSTPDHRPSLCMKERKQ